MHGCGVSMGPVQLTMLLVIAMTKIEKLKDLAHQKDLLAYREGGKGVVFETLKIWLEKGYTDLVLRRLEALVKEYQEYCKNQEDLSREFEELFEDRKCLHDQEVSNV